MPAGWMRPGELHDLNVRINFWPGTCNESACNVCVSVLFAGCKGLRRPGGRRRVRGFAARLLKMPSPTAEYSRVPGMVALRGSETSMVRKYVRAARDAGVLDWIFLAVGILVIGLGVAYADLRPATDAGDAPNGDPETWLAISAARPH